MERNDIIGKLYTITHNLNLTIHDEKENFIMVNNVDSINFVELVINIEEEFSIRISEEYMIIDEMNSILKIIQIIERQLESDTHV